MNLKRKKVNAVGVGWGGEMVQQVQVLVTQA